MVTPSGNAVVAESISTATLPGRARNTMYVPSLARLEAHTIPGHNPPSSRPRSTGSRCTTRSRSISGSTVSRSCVCTASGTADSPALYPILYYAYYHDYDRLIVSEEWTFVYCVLLGAGHALAFLTTRWSAAVDSKITATTVSACMRQRHG